jgi:hypothetical protein
MNTAQIAAHRFEITFAARALQALQALADRLVARAPSPALRRHIDKNATAWIEHPAGRTVTCDAGTLWLTFDGEPEDVILEAGQTHRCTHRSRLAIHALDPAAVRVA